MQDTVRAVTEHLLLGRYFSGAARLSSRIHPRYDLLVPLGDLRRLRAEDRTWGDHGHRGVQRDRETAAHRQGRAEAQPLPQSSAGISRNIGSDGNTYQKVAVA